MAFQYFKSCQLRRGRCSQTFVKLFVQTFSWKMSIKFKKRSGLSGKSNLFQKIFKNFSYFIDGNRPTKIAGKNITTLCSSEQCSIKYCQFNNFPMLPVQTRLEITHDAILTIREQKILIASNSLKKYFVDHFIVKLLSCLYKSQKNSSSWS